MAKATEPTTPRRIHVRHFFAYQFKGTKLPEGVSNAEPTHVTNDNVEALWPHIAAEDRQEFIDGRYVDVLFGEGSKAVPSTPANQPAGTRGDTTVSHTKPPSR